MNVLAVHLERRTVWWLGEPDVEVLAFARFKEHDIVAVVEVGKLIELLKLGFGVEFGVLAAVR